MLTAVVATPNGNIIDLEGYAPVGMAGDTAVRLTDGDMIAMPFGGELMMLPDRIPILFNLDSGRCEPVLENPFVSGEPVYPVAAFNSPGYVNLYSTAYTEKAEANVLPLFSYGAAGWADGEFRTSVILVDSEKRQDLRFMPYDKIVKGVRRIRQKTAKNRLRRHIEKCAITYGCPAAKNFFLGRFEAPLPTSKSCNANCVGCLSKQQNSDITASQDRIDFTPTPSEIAEIALIHIRRVKRAVVSFGQGCEGDPLTAADVIGPAIEKIRSATDSGTINMNTNGSLPKILEKLFDQGLDSVRISMNSVRENCYNAYFRPKSYRFADVLSSIETALFKGKFISINYLNCPGFTDSEAEVQALRRFLENYPIGMIQWRNLNFDPAGYTRLMSDAGEHGPSIGVKRLIESVKRDFPHIMNGYFNPPKEKFSYRRV